MGNPSERSSDEVVELIVLERHAAAHDVVPRGLAGIGQREADGGVRPSASSARTLRLVEPAAAHVVARRLAARELLLAPRLELGGGAVAPIRATGLEQRVGPATVEIAALRLEVRTEAACRRRGLRPMSSPSQRMLSRIGGDRLVGRPRGVGVLDPQHEGAALSAREQVVVERGAGAADVEVAGRARGEADANAQA